MQSCAADYVPYTLIKPYIKLIDLVFLSSNIATIDGQLHITVQNSPNHHPTRPACDSSAQKLPRRRNVGMKQSVYLHFTISAFDCPTSDV